MKSLYLVLGSVLVFACGAPTKAEHEAAPVPPAVPTIVREPLPTASGPSPTPPPSGSAAEDTREPPPPDERIVAKSGRVAFTHAGALWVTDEKGQNPRALVAASGFAVVNQPDAEMLQSTDIQSLTFSPDEARVYFMKPGWATSMALFYADIKSSKVFLFHDANGYSIISTCKDKKQVGRVITFEHSYDLNPMSAMDMIFLVDSAEPALKDPRTGPSGRVGIIGSDQANLDRFLAKTCGQGKLPPNPPKVPAKLAAALVQCGELKLKHADLALLDGTKLVRFTSSTSGGEGEIIGLADVVEICMPQKP